MPIQVRSVVYDGSEAYGVVTEPDSSLYSIITDRFPSTPTGSYQWSTGTLNSVQVGVLSAGTFPDGGFTSVRITVAMILVETIKNHETTPELPPTEPPPGGTVDPPPRDVRTRLEVDWDFDGTYTDETERIIGVRGTHKLVPPSQAVEASTGIVSTMVATLHNEDGRYSSVDSAGTLYSDVAFGQAYHAPARFSVTTDGGSSWNQIFQGVIKIPREETVIPKKIRAIVLDCRGNEEKIINRRLSTTQTKYQSFIATQRTEAQLIQEILTTAGINPANQVIDSGLFYVPFFHMHNQSVLETCWQLAASAGGRFYCNYQGDYVYENMRHWFSGAAHTVSQGTYDRGYDGVTNTFGFTDLRLTYDDNNLSKKVTVAGQLGEVEPNQEVYNKSVLTTVRAGSNTDVVIQFDTPVSQITSFTFTQTGSASITRFDYAQGIILNVNNASGGNTTITNVVVFGTPVTFNDKVASTRTSTSTFWIPQRQEKERRVNNTYIQSGIQADTLAAFLVDRQETPNLMYELLDCPGESGRYLGDLITITDEKVLDTARRAFVIGIDWTYDLNGFRQTLKCIDEYFTAVGSGGTGSGGGSGDPNEGGGGSGTGSGGGTSAQDFFIIGTDVLAPTGTKIITY